MKYKVDKSLRPVYLQIYKQIKEDIIDGSYPYNAKLPSKRLLADETETSTVTIEHAYALLCDEGYVESRERSGFFVIFRNSDGRHRGRAWRVRGWLWGSWFLLYVVPWTPSSPWWALVLL